MITMPPVRHFEPQDAGAIAFSAQKIPMIRFTLGYPWVSCGLSLWSLSQTWLSGYVFDIVSLTHPDDRFKENPVFRDQNCVYICVLCMPFILRYPLVMTNIAIENGNLVRGFTHWTWWFSIVMLIYQGVFKTLLAGRSPICRCTEHGLVFLPGWIATWCAMVLKLNYRTRILLESVRTLISCHSLLSFISFHAVSSHAMHSFIISFFQYFNTSIFHAFVRSSVHSFVHSFIRTNMQWLV
jgi:hypothetical protein